MLQFVSHLRPEDLFMLPGSSSVRRVNFVRHGDRCAWIDYTVHGGPHHGHCDAVRLNLDDTVELRS